MKTKLFTSGNFIYFAGGQGPDVPIPKVESAEGQRVEQTPGAVGNEKVDAAGDEGKKDLGIKINHAAASADKLDTKGKTDANPGDKITEGKDKYDLYLDKMHDEITANTGRIYEAVVASVKVDKDKDPKEEGISQQKFDERMEAFKKRDDEYKGKVMALTPGLVSGFKASGKESNTLIGSIIADRAKDIEKDTSTFTAAPDSVAKEAYDRFLHGGEAQGGMGLGSEEKPWATLKDLVSKGDVKWDAFTKRADAINKVIATTADKAEALKNKYC